jgi:hypothetical protein
MDFTEDQEDLRNRSAVIIQKKWRQFREAMGGDREGEGGDESRELTEGERRTQLLERFRELLDMRDTILAQNLMNQRRVGKRLAEGKGQDRGEAGTVAAADAEAKYWATVQKMHSDRMELEAKQNVHDDEIAASRENQQSYIERAMEAEEEFLKLVVDSATKAVFPRNNKGLPPQKVQEYVQMEEVMSHRLHEARLSYIKQRNRNKKLTAQLKEKEKLITGLHLIDFEQLKIENTTLNEKIEERNEDLLKLRKKSTTTIHILTHVKEKLECVKGENILLLKGLQALEMSLGEQRDKLAQAKRERDAYVNENIRMREKMPMIGSEDLLLDYELRKKEIADRRIEVVNLTNNHHELVQKISRLQPILESLSESKDTTKVGPSAKMDSRATANSLRVTN